MEQLNTLLKEDTDETEQKKELACVGGVCDIDMIEVTAQVPRVQ